MTRWLIVCALILTACTADPTQLSPTTGAEAASALPPGSTLPPQPAAWPTLVVVLPPPVADCGPEAAISLAQAQSDLALAAVGQVDVLRQNTQDNALIGQGGQKSFTLAKDLMTAYAVPECLAQAKAFALEYFDKNIAAYTALAAGDQTGYETNLNHGEVARQNMTTEVNKLLGP